MTTIAEEKIRLRAEVHDGTTCGACGQFVKLYRRSINAGMAAALIRIYRASQDSPSTAGWVDIREIPNVRGGDYAKLRFWGLLEQAPKGDGTAGLWRPTVEGGQFVGCERRVGKYVHVYNGSPVQIDAEAGPYVSITDALGARFDYNELMRGL